MSIDLSFSGIRGADAFVAPPIIPVGEAGGIGIVVTAPDRDTAKVPLNRPWDIVGDFGKAAALGAAGTALPVLTQIWGQQSRRSPKMSVVVVEEAADDLTPAGANGGSDRASVARTDVVAQKEIDVAAVTGRDGV